MALVLKLFSLFIGVLIGGAITAELASIAADFTCKHMFLGTSLIFVWCGFALSSAILIEECIGDYLGAEPDYFSRKVGKWALALGIVGTIWYIFANV